MTAALLETGNTGETKLLIEAFETFTSASNSLESVFCDLKAHVQRLTDELEAKNLELEKSLRDRHEAQSYLKKILDLLPCGVIVLDKDGRLTLRNPVASEVLGTSKDMSGLNPDLRAYLTTSAGKDESNTEIEIQFDRAGKHCVLATSGTRLIGNEGESIGTVHIIRDITDMKALQEQSKRVERLSAMGEMAAELAHEIRNPLGSIELFASLLMKDLSGDARLWAENIKLGTRSLNTIVSNMLHFANPVEPEFGDVDLHEVISEVIGFTGPIMKQRQVDVETNLRSRHPVIAGNHELLKQVMLNLIFNAMKAMPSQGALLIATRDLDGDRVELEICDTGIGIPAKNLSRIFDPFFTTNKNGTGLGLSVVHQIVEKHSGSVRVSSELNRGTTFTIVFHNHPKKEMA